MRRTYRSKKDTGGALDHRDVLLNMDEKSSAFEAFYIRNIKQTKRELSYVRSSNVYGASTKKVRKKKYVKRIVKEVENVPPRESMSSSTFLTPDKSIRVNKILDPFDQLLSSSSTSQGVAAPTKNYVNDIPQAKKESKTYTRKKTRNIKKFNYSSDDSSDSDKENASNTTDIRSHKLLIEREHNNKSQNSDESINRIFTNQSLKNNFKRKNSFFNTSYKNHKWTNCQSPILQKSPLCSTPFKEKYRGKSIYNFSPISTKERESSNYVTITEENNESNNSIVFLFKEKVPKLSKEHSSPQTSVPDKDEAIENDVSMIYENEIDPQLDVSKTETLEPKEKESSTSNKYESVLAEQSLFQITEAEPFLGFSNKESPTNDGEYLLKCIQEPNSEHEEMNMSGGCNVDQQNEENIDSTEIYYNGREKSHLFSVGRVNQSRNESKSNKDIPLKILSNIEKSLENLSDDSYKNNSAENQGASIVYKEDTICDSSSSDSDKESMYDTCESEHSFPEIQRDLIPLASPKVAVERLSDSVFLKYHEKGKKEPKVVIERLNDSIIFKYHEKVKKEPIVAIERLNDSVFSKYYDKIQADNNSSCDMSIDESHNEVETSQTQPDITSEYDNQNEAASETKTGDTSLYDSQSENETSQSHTSDNTSEYNVSQSEVDGSQTEVDDTLTYNDSFNEAESMSNADEVNKSDDNDISLSNSEINVSSTSQNTESDTAESQTINSEMVLNDSSAAEDIESDDQTDDDEKHAMVSFVTTRKRNEITNDSMFIFDNSYGSTSTECDNTVLSNTARLSYLEKSDLEVDVSVNNHKTSDASYFTLCEDNLPQTDNTDVNIDGAQRNTRNSSIPTRVSGVEDTDMNSSIIEVLTGNELTDNKMLTIVSPNQTKVHKKSSVTIRESSRASVSDRFSSINTEFKPNIVLQPGKKWERSLSIYRRMTMMADHYNQSLIEDDSQNKGRKYRQSVINTMEMQDSLHNESINSRRSTFISKPTRPTIRFVKDSINSSISLNTTEVFDDLKGFLTEECDDTVIELSKLSLADSEFEVTVLDNFHETSGRLATARDYVLRRCNQTEPILFDECYPETVLKNCHKIGEGVYGEVYLWRGRDGRARVMKVVPIAGACKVNGEQQKDFHEVISEIVIAMELSALRAPIADIDRYFDEGKDVEALDLHSVENATDVFNEVLAVRCVQGPYPSRLLDLWELYDECKGSENDNPAALPADQQYMVLELANAGQDLESYHFTGAQQAHALFQQIAFGLAVGEESFQFEHRDLHWGNVLIAPTEQKLATFVLRGRTYRVPRGGVAATIIDYSLSRISLPLAAERAALYNDLSTDEQLFDAVGDYQFQIYRHMRDKLGNDWKNFEPYTNILWLHYTVDKMITALRYKRTTTKIHKHYIEKLKGIKERILDYKSATEYVLTDIEI